MLSDGRTWVVVLAGGIGSRFWPASTPERPKQLLPLAGGEPLITETIRRALELVPAERIRVLASQHLADRFRTVVDELPPECYWVEPRARGTAPVLAWAAHRLRGEEPEAVMISLHSDHLIRPIEALASTLERAVEVARREELLMCIGVGPDRAETGYGYVELGDPVADVAGAYRVRDFHEKPDAETAAAYVAAGHLWNTGIFVWTAAGLLSEVDRVAPEISGPLGDPGTSDEAFFDAVPISVVDRAVMERSERVGTVVADFEWDDLGSWEALRRVHEADLNGNVVVGDGRMIDAADNIVFSDSGAVVVFGARDLIVVRTKDATLVLPRQRAAEMRELLAALEADP